MKKPLIAGMIIVLLSSIFLIVGLNYRHAAEKDKISIVATNFPAYDFARATTNGSREFSTTLITPPGIDLHQYEFTPADIERINQADLLIYNGGESDSWVERLLASLNPRPATLRMMDYTEPSPEDDEHIWTSPTRAKSILSAIAETIIPLAKNPDIIQDNTNNYLASLSSLDTEIRDLVAHSSRQHLVFADRFPLTYFVNDYHLTYTAAFPGCSEQTEADAGTLARLIDTIKNEHLPIVFKIELTSDKLAQAVSEATGAKILTFYTMHNISSEDYYNGTTYLDLMRRNIKSLEEALRA